MILIEKGYGQKEVNHVARCRSHFIRRRCISKKDT